MGSYFNNPLFADICFVPQYVVFSRETLIRYWEESVFLQCLGKMLSRYTLGSFDLLMPFDSDVSLFAFCLGDNLSIAERWILKSFIISVLGLLWALMPYSMYFMELDSPGFGAFIFRIVMGFGGWFLWSEWNDIYLLWLVLVWPMLSDMLACWLVPLA